MSGKNKLIHSVTAGEGLLVVGSRSELMVCISQPAKTEILLCDRINISLPVGADADCLFDTAVIPELTVETEGWSSQNSGRAVIEDGKSAVFSVVPDGGISSELKTPVICSIAGMINAVPGSALVHVKDRCESYEEANDTVHYLVKELKEKPYVHNFMSFHEASRTVPRMYFAPGEKIVFTWESKDGEYRIYNGRNGQVIYQGEQTAYTYGKGISEDTPFILEAKFTDAVLKAQGVEGRGEKILYAVLSLYTDRQEYFADKIYTNHLKVYDTAELPVKGCE